jgi:hypothetical protein
MSGPVPTTIIVANVGVVLGVHIVTPHGQIQATT